MAEDVVGSIQSGEADLGFVHRQVASTRLTARTVDREELVLIAAPAHPVPPPEGLAAAGFVTYDESEDVFACWFGQVAGAALPQLRSCAHFEELEEVLDWVAAGRGLSIVPADCAQAHAASGRLDIHRPEGRRCFNSIFAIHDTIQAHPLVQRVLDAVAARHALA